VVLIVPDALLLNWMVMLIVIVLSERQVSAGRQTVGAP